MISPNGDYIAFSSDRTGPFNIFIYDYQDRATRQLTESPKDDRYPNWSSDSRKLVFCSDRTGKGDIYEMDRDGNKGYLQLTDNKALEEYPCYKPHTNNILFARAAKRGVLRKEMNVVFMERGGTPGTVLVLSEGDEARYSPDGRKVVFVSHRTKNNDIWRMDADGGLQTQLTTADKDDENPAFSPDGKHIVFASKRTGNFDIWVMDSDGGNLRQLTSHQADEKQPCWSVGGYIYYTRKMSETTSNIFRIPAPR
jgi:TolB protein